MLRRLLLGTPTKFGVGANGAGVASHFIQKYGCIDIDKSSWHEKQYLDQKVQDSLDSEKVGVVVLDDAMQVLQLFSPPDFFISLLIYYSMVFFLMVIRDPENSLFPY